MNIIKMKIYYKKYYLMKKEFRLMSLYNKGEYNLLHDQYIRRIYSFIKDKVYNK